MQTYLVADALGLRNGRNNVAHKGNGLDKKRVAVVLHRAVALGIGGDVPKEVSVGCRWCKVSVWDKQKQTDRLPETHSQE
jgi:hypothetical protein